MPKKQQVIQFRLKMKELRPRLPLKYGTIARAIDPDLSIHDIHNTAKGKSCNEYIYSVLLKVVELHKNNS